MTDLPKVRITNKTGAAFRSMIELDGNDVSRWVRDYEVIGRFKDYVVLRLELLVGNLEIESPVLAQISLQPDLKDLLIKNGWTPPSDEDAA